MSKTARKMKKKQERKQTSTLAKNFAEKKEKVTVEIDKGEYAEALDIVAELVRGGCRDADVMYKAAYAYYMLDDFKRAAEWVQNTLEFDQGNIDARLLLGKVCLEENRIKDAYAIYEMLVENIGKLNISQQNDIKQDVRIYGMESGLEAEYPELAKFVQGTLYMVGIDDAQVANADSVEGQEEVNEWKNPVPDVLAKNISAREKVRLLNAFAAGFYQESKYDYAAFILEKALELKEYEQDTIRNLSLVYAHQGEKNKALEIFSKLEIVDLVLLDAIGREIG